MICPRSTSITSRRPGSDRSPGNIIAGSAVLVPMSLYAVTTAGSTIVVGVDGSEADELRWASRQADLTGAALCAVTTWEAPTGDYGLTIAIPIDPNRASDSRRVLERIIVEALVEDRAAKVRATVVEGHPAKELLNAAQTAELLVVGNRGHGAFAGMLLGSVSEHCVAHAPCPVVVVHHHARRLEAHAVDPAAS